MTMAERMIVIAGTMFFFVLFGLLARNKPWRWAWLLPVAVPVFCIAQFRLIVLPELLQGGFIIFGLMGCGLGLLGLTHIGANE